MTVKKVFEPIIAILTRAVEADKKAKVSDVLAEIMAIAEAKVNRGEGSTFIKDASGKVVAINDYYFKRWMPLVGPKAVEFGAKAKTTTGFNTMCKAGVSHWTKQQRVADDANKALLEEVKAGTLAHTDIAARQVEIEVARKAIAPAVVTTKAEDGTVSTIELGFVSEDEVKAYLTEQGVVLA